MLRRRAFTLIELLVVIAIIALLVAILLPALGKARKAALLAKSLSNIRQITTASKNYQDSNKDRMPLTVSTVPRGDRGNPGGWCTWAFGGKNCWPNAWVGANAVFDVEAADRPLNPYLTDDIIDAPAGNVPLPQNDLARTIFQLPVFNDPSDKIGHQRAWPSENIDNTSCYDDVGTSYQFQVHWWDQLPTSLPFLRRFAAGCARMTLADSFQPSRFVWIYDEYSDLVANNLNPNFRLKNGYDDINRSVMGFMDGHANYHPVYPGATPQSFDNALYTFIFTDMRPQ